MKTWRAGNSPPMRPWQGLARSRCVASALAAVCAGVCVCLVVVSQQRGLGGSSAVLMQEAGGGNGESLAAMERQKVRLQSFISQEDGGRRGEASASAARSGDGVAAKKAKGKHCGKLCQTRKMILKARGSIDAQAHVELQQLAVSDDAHYPLCNSQVVRNKVLSMRPAPRPLASSLSVLCRLHRQRLTVWLMAVWVQ